MTNLSSQALCKRMLLGRRNRRSQKSSVIMKMKKSKSQCLETWTLRDARATPPGKFSQKRRRRKELKPKKLLQDIFCRTKCWNNLPNLGRRSVNPRASPAKNFKNRSSLIKSVSVTVITAKNRKNLNSLVLKTPPAAATKRSTGPCWMATNTKAL